MTTATTMNDIVQASRIQALLHGSHLSPPVALSIVWALAIPPGTGGSIAIPRVAIVATNAGSKVEGADFGLVETSTDTATLTPGYVGHADEVSDEVSYDAQENAMAIVVERGVQALMDRVDSDVLALGATAATDSDFTDAALTEARLVEAQADYLANEPHDGDVACVLGRRQIRDLKLDMSQNGGAHWGADAASMRMQELLGLKRGFEGEFYGMAVFSSGNVVDAASNNTGFICKMGDQGALAYGVWEGANVEYRRLPRSKEWELTMAIRYGVAISDPLNLHAVISQSV